MRVRSMGRNKGDAARSKFRTSSSSLAASLLQTPVTSAVGFGGFVGSSRVDLAPSVDGEHLADVDGDAVLHVRRLSKKDPTTKVKAIAALTTLFEERPAAELLPLLPLWVFEYKRLVQDSNRQVRQSTHVAMTSLATSVGRGLAPHLRALMGAWWVAQFDPSREVLEAAQTSFQVAFPGQKKRLEALMFCGNAIFSHLDDNLNLTPTTISEKSTPIEESTEKFERVVSCSLLALAALIDVLVGSAQSSSFPETAESFVGETSVKTRALVKEAATKLCWNHKFLKQFIKAKSSCIRSATYQALRAFIQNLPQVFREEDMAVVVPSILGTFQEKDPACHQHMWDMVLLFAKGFPLAWSTSVVTKVVLPRLWGFLQHGCYGSQQVSYPYLLPLISLIPSKAIVPEQNFFMEFFSSLWEGRSATLVRSTDHVALLQAIQECLIWSVLNAKRFSYAEGYETAQVQSSLIDGVLLKLLWHDYVGALPLLNSASLNSSESSLSTKVSASNGPGVSSTKFTQDLGACIVQTIQILSGHGDHIMSGFWDEFQAICFQIVQEAGNLWQSAKEDDLRISRIAEFIIMLGCKTSKSENREQWSLIHAVRPFLAKSFPAIRSLGHPESIRLVAKLTSIYGPTVFSLLCVSTFHGRLNDQKRQVQDLEDDDIVQYFRENLVPWCVDGNGDLNGPKAELVLSFIENHRFQGEWEYVVGHVTGFQEDKDDTVFIKKVGVLATLLEKIRERGDSRARHDDNVDRENVIGADWWKSPRIDKATITVASSNHLAHQDCLRLIRSALGGTSSEQALLPLVSDKAAIQILGNLLMRVLSILSASTINWVRAAAHVIMGLGVSDSLNLSRHQEITEESLQLAVPAINVLGSCTMYIFSSEGKHTVGVKFLAAIFCLNWTCSDADPRVCGDGNDSAEEYDTDWDEEEEGAMDDCGSLFEGSLELKTSGDINASEDLGGDPSSRREQGLVILRESLHLVRQKISPLCKSFAALTRFRLRQVLIMCLRLAVCDEEFETSQHAAARCSAWAKEVVGYTCEFPDEVSEFLNLLLAPEDSWPWWVVAPSAVEKQTGRTLPVWKDQRELTEIEIQRHDRFVTFVDHLCRSLSPQEVFLDTFQVTEVTEDKMAERESKIGCASCRTWLVVELVCTWEWPGGSAVRHVLPFLCSFAQSRKESIGYNLLWGTIEALFIGASSACPTSEALDVNNTTVDEPFLRALLVILKGLLEKEDGWRNADARELFRQYVTREDAVDLVSPICDVQILPHVLSVLMPILRKRGTESSSGSNDEDYESFLQTAVSVWLQKAMTRPPLVACGSGFEIPGNQWIRVAVACFPLNSAGGAAAMASASSAPVTSQERELLLALLRKQFSREAVAGVAAFAAVDRSSPHKASAQMKRNEEVEVTLTKLVAAAIGYCWLDFGTEEWEFILRKLRVWLQMAVIEVEEFTEAVVEAVKESLENADSEEGLSVVKALENLVTEKSSSPVKLYSMAVAVFSLLRGLSNLEGVDSTDAFTNLKVANWEILEIRALEDILRMLLAIGLAESAAPGSIAGENGGNVIASFRKSQSQFWENVADVALGASNQAREAAIRAVDLWGAGKGAISSLYAHLFSPLPTISLQWVAYQFLSTGQILQMAVTHGIVVSGESKSKIEDESMDEGKARVEEVSGGDSQRISPALVAQIRPELASILQTTHPVIVRSPLTSPLRVGYLLGWSLFLTRLQSLTAFSPTRQRLVQYVQDSDISSTLLDCLFQYIPLEHNFNNLASRRKSLAAGVKMSSAAAPATRAAATGSVAFAVEGLWPVQKEGLITLAGALYGLMLAVLPACVRFWFCGLRDKTLASAIEAFTTAHCSPQLLADEFSQVQASVVDEENLSIRANRSLREVTAIYKKEEAGMDIVIRIPPCYPLRAVDVDCTRRMGINETLLRKWILSMASFLRNQNGAVAEAVQMWKKNVDREFEGVEECPICYSIIHTSNHNLPRLACKTCRHKFHSACLYKWFSTSHQSTCPLCKTPF